MVGFAEKFPTIDDFENFPEISKMWSELSPAKMQQLMSVSDGKVTGFLGISNECGLPEFTYQIGMTSHEQPSGLSVVSFPVGEWLIFDCLGALPDAMMNLKEWC